jgi:inositol 1,4,5-triphosphate receptor type 1
VQAVELGIALLEGGHQDIQKSLYILLTGGDLSQSFFHVFHEKINDAQVKADYFNSVH